MDRNVSADKVGRIIAVILLFLLAISRRDSDSFPLEREYCHDTTVLRAPGEQVLRAPGEQVLRVAGWAGRGGRMVMGGVGIVAWVGRVVMERIGMVAWVGRVVAGMVHERAPLVLTLVAGMAHECAPLVLSFAVKICVDIVAWRMAVVMPRVKR